MDYGLIGGKLGHSYSKDIHEMLADYTYDLCPLTKEEFVPFMEQHAFRAINVTIPYKQDVIPYLDSLDDNAKAIGAVNTIVNEDGKLVGHITDGEGFVDNLKDHGIDIKGKKITVAGGGGAATAIQVQSALSGAREISIFNIKDEFFQRTLDTAEKIRKSCPECTVNVYDIADQQKMKAEIKSS